MITSAIKNQTSVCCYISLNPYMVFQTWNHGYKKIKKKSNSIVSLLLMPAALPIASFYMQTLSLIFKLEKDDL